MASRVESFLQLLGHEPMTVYLIGDVTGYELAEIQDTLEYMEEFGMVDHRQGYWVRPDKIAERLTAINHGCQETRPQPLE